MHLAFGTLLLTAASVSSPLWVGRFSGAGDPPNPWHLVKYSSAKPTIYRLTSIRGHSAVEADVDGSMALLARPISVNLSATPIMCWRWYVEQPVAKADMRVKNGDDYAARVYLGFDMPDSEMSGSAKLRLRLARTLFGKSIPDAGLVYVWDNRNPVGTARRSSYTDRIQLIVAETGSTHAGQWVSERADVAGDFGRAFDGKSGAPVQLAIASDGDNTRSRNRAAFADLHFVERGQACDL